MFSSDLKIIFYQSTHRTTFAPASQFSLPCRMGSMIAIVPQLRSPLSEVHYPIFSSAADLLENLVIFTSIHLDLACESIGAVRRVDYPSGVASVEAKQPSADCNDPTPIVAHRPSASTPSPSAELARDRHLKGCDQQDSHHWIHPHEDAGLKGLGGQHICSRIGYLVDGIVGGGMEHICSSTVTMS